MQRLIPYLPCSLFIDQIFAQKNQVCTGCLFTFRRCVVKLLKYIHQTRCSSPINCSNATFVLSDNRMGKYDSDTLFKRYETSYLYLRHTGVFESSPMSWYVFKYLHQDNVQSSHLSRSSVTFHSLSLSRQILFSRFNR